MNNIVFQSPIGPIEIQTDKEIITEIVLQSRNPISQNIPIEFQILVNKILDFLHGKTTKIDCKYTQKETDFSKKVYQEMAKIPYGETISYQELARRSGNEKAVRAVGTCCSHNKIPLMIPCHRVIKKNGDIGEFGGDRSVKKYLIDLEKHSKKELGL